MNDHQLHAVESEAPRIVVAAGPGSGKTKTLVERVMRRSDRIKKVVLLTFTNAAALELARRLQGIRVDYIGTLHGYCYRLLQAHGAQLGYRVGGINLVTEEVSDEILAQAAKDMGFKGSGKALKEKRTPLADLVWKEYAHRLKRNNLTDFNTVLSEGLKLAEKGLGGCDELFIDECQDSAEIDWRIYRAIEAESKFFVGDNDQSIFGFRGAFPKGFLRLCNDPGTELIRLEENYRSGPRICAAATALIRHNQDRIDKDVIATDIAIKDEIGVSRFTDCAQERRYTVQHIQGVLEYTTPSEVAVLCRTNWLCGQFRDALLAAGIPVAAAERVDLPQDWQHGINVLSLWLDPRNDMIAERVLKKVAPARITTCKKEALDAGIWLSTTFLPPGHVDTIDAALFVLPRLMVSREMQELVAERRRMLPQAQPTLADLLADLWAHAAGDPGAQSAGVRVSTLHGAKGTEADVVFIPACEEGILPNLKKDSDIEEERRLFFVGITRARKELYLSHAAKRIQQWGGVTEQTPSRFITEAGL